MGTTPNYGLRIPTDPNAQADFIVIVGALGNDVDLALKGQVDQLTTSINGKSASTHTHAYSPSGHTHAYSPSGHSHAYAPSSHSHAYAPTTHNHLPSQSRIITGTLMVATSLAAGQQKTASAAKNPDELVIFSTGHPSTYIAFAMQAMATTYFTIEARNTTKGTTHSNIWVAYARIQMA